MHRQMVIRRSNLVSIKSREGLLKLHSFTADFELYEFDGSISPDLTDERLRIGIFTIGLRMHRQMVIRRSNLVSIKSREVLLKLPSFTADFEFYEFDGSISPDWTDERLRIGIFTIGLRIHRQIVIRRSNLIFIKSREVLLKLPSLTANFEFYEFHGSISPDWTDERLRIGTFTIGLRMHRQMVIRRSNLFFIKGREV